MQKLVRVYAVQPAAERHHCPDREDTASENHAAPLPFYALFCV